MLVFKQALQICKDGKVRAHGWYMICYIIELQSAAYNVVRLQQHALLENSLAATKVLHMEGLAA